MPIRLIALLLLCASLTGCARGPNAKCSLVNHDPGCISFLGD